jgi:hypothetical protein
MDFEIQLWTPDHDCTEFTSSFKTIEKYIREQAARATSSKTSTVFVLTEKGAIKVRGYYTLSSMSIKFDNLPKAVQRKLPRYPQIGATILGRLGVDEVYRDQLINSGKKPRLGELLLVDAQKNCLKGAATVASAVMLIDVKQPSTEEIAAGARDPIGFYTQYGFVALPKTPRTVFKRLSTIEKELEAAKLLEKGKYVIAVR